MLTHGLLLLVVTRVLQAGNQIGDRGAETIGEGLKLHSSLQSLHLVRLLFMVCVLIVAELYVERLNMFQHFFGTFLS